MLPRYLTDPLRFAVMHGWRPLFPRTRRDGLHTWTNQPRGVGTAAWLADPVHRDPTLRVTVDISGEVTVMQLMHHTGWIRIASVRVGHGRAVVDVLAALAVIPDCYSSAYLRGAEFGAGLRLNPERLARVMAALRPEAAA